MGANKLGKRVRTKIDRLAESAINGDQQALSELENLDGAQADYAETLAREYAVFGEQTEKTLISLVCGKNLLAAQELRQSADRLRSELAGPKPSPIESLLVDLIVCCWIQMNEAQSWCAAAVSEFDGTDSPSRVEGYLQERLNHAQRRYLAAVKSLAQLRKLVGPNIQVNVAEKQINVMGGN